MKIEISRAGAGDIRELTVLVGEYRQELSVRAGLSENPFDRQTTETQLAEFLGNADYAVFIARSVRGHPLGYLTVFESSPYHNDTHGLLEQVFVRPFYRRRRIGRRLLAESRRLAGQRKWRRILLTLPGESVLDSGLAFFEKEGFSDTGRKRWLLT